MKNQISKKLERSEKKKRKLAALASLVKLNDKDRESLASNSSTIMNSGGESSDELSKTKKMKIIRDESEGENVPETKKAKLENKSSTVAEALATDEKNDSDSSSSKDLEKIKVHLTEDQYVQLKRELRERKRKLENVPMFRLRENGRRACLDVPQDNRTPIFLTDIQNLLMSVLVGKKSPCSPERWCFLEKPLKLSHTVILTLDGLSLYHYLSNETGFEKTNKIFETKLEVVLPPCKKGNIIKELATVPLTNVQAQELIDMHGCLETAMEMNKDPTLLVKTIFPMEEESTADLDAAKVNRQSNDKFPRTKLLLSALQMVDDSYPMPLRGELQARYKNYVFTKEKYAPVTESSPMYGIDCEMCRTTSGFNELTRISVVNEHLETVYETLVMPTNKIVDYLTKYSGITPELMQMVTKKLHEVQAELRELLPPDAILVGQSLNSDLNAMKMMHPYVIDTSVIFNLTGDRRRKSKLQKLAMTFLDQVIQDNADGHDSVEDSIASMKLVKMKLANNMDFGDIILTQKRRFHDIIRLETTANIKNNLFAYAAKKEKRAAIVTTGTLDEEIKKIIKKATTTKAENFSDQDSLTAVRCLELETNKDAIQKAREIALEHSLTIINLTVSPEQFQLDRREKTVSKIDKWISKLWKTVAHNGMFLVLMGGSSECPSGVVKIAIKKNIADVAAEVPITV